MTKIRQGRPTNNLRENAFFYIFRIYSLEIFEGGGLGAWPPVAPSWLRSSARSRPYVKLSRLSHSGCSVFGLSQTIGVGDGGTRGHVPP